MNLNLSRFVPKLQRDQAPYFKDAATAERAIEEYRRMLTLVQMHPEAPVVPSKLVDLVWHEHVRRGKRLLQHPHLHPRWGHSRPPVANHRRRLVSV